MSAPGVDVPRRPRDSANSLGHVSLQRPKSAILADSDIGSRYLRWFNVVLPAISGVSAVGAAVSLFALLSQIQDPERLNSANINAPTSSRFGRETVRSLLAVAFLLFAMTLGFANFATLLVVFHAEDIRDGFNQLPRFGDKRRKVGRAIDYKWCSVAFAILLQLLVLGAFLSLSLVVVAYVEPVGWISTGFTTTFILVMIYLWLFRPTMAS